MIGVGSILSIAGSAYSRSVVTNKILSLSRGYGRLRKKFAVSLSIAPSLRTQITITRNGDLAGSGNGAVPDTSEMLREMF